MAKVKKKIFEGGCRIAAAIEAYVGIPTETSAKIAALPLSERHGQRSDDKRRRLKVKRACHSWVSIGGASVALCKLWRVTALALRYAASGLSWPRFSSILSIPASSSS